MTGVLVTVLAIGALAVVYRLAQRMYRADQHDGCLPCEGTGMVRVSWVDDVNGWPPFVPAPCPSCGGTGREVDAAKRRHPSGGGS